MLKSPFASRRNARFRLDAPKKIEEVDGTHVGLLHDSIQTPIRISVFLCAEGTQFMIRHFQQKCIR